MRSLSKAKVSTFFYSINSRVVEFEGPFLDCTNPYFFFMLSDRICAWDGEHAQWLKEIGYAPEQITVFGPTVFALSEVESDARKHGSTVKQVTVFDVPPLIQARLLKIGFGGIYYSFEIIESFLHDIHRACREAFGEKGYVIRLKLKKGQAADIHDARYWKIIEEMEKNPQIQIFDSKLFMHSLLTPAPVDFVVSFPFSSPSNVAHGLKINSCFYDPTGKVANPFQTDDHPPLVRGYRELLSFFARKPLSHHLEADK